MRRLGTLLLIVVVVSLAACRRSVPAKPAAVSAPSPSAYDLEIGRNVYLAYCATCHGEKGAGAATDSTLSISTRLPATSAIRHSRRKRAMRISRT